MPGSSVQRPCRIVFSLTLRPTVYCPPMYFGRGNGDTGYNRITIGRIQVFDGCPEDHFLRPVTALGTAVCRAPLFAWGHAELIFITKRLYSHSPTWFCTM